MFTATEKSIILLCVSVLIGSPLFAQNDFLPFPVPAHPEKEFSGKMEHGRLLPTLPPLSTPGKESAVDTTSPLLLAAKKALINIVDYDEFFFTTALRSPTATSRPRFPFVDSYEKSDHAFWDFIEKIIHEDTVRKNEEKRFIREAWEEWLGVDIWYPYFKAKEIEDWICDRFKVRIFRFKGRLKFEKEGATYSFKMQF